jgi:UPF0755 protein
MRRLLLLSALFVLTGCHSSVPTPAGRVEVLIRPGMSVEAIGDTLAGRNVISDPLQFRFLAWFYGYGRELHPGRYQLATNSGALHVLKMLSREEPALLMVTIPEGLTMGQTAGVLARSGASDSAAFLAACADSSFLAGFGIAAPNAEGYLFPETYELSTAMSARDIAGVLLRQFASVLDSLRSSTGTPEPSNPLPLSSLVTLASIVEREAQAPDEYARIAGVFVNRLRRHMPLQSCATVEYVLPEHKACLTVEDTRIESPYNTYLHSGLPPGPICSPGRRALEAALHPERHDLLFFVSRGDGTHIFSRTLAEHLAAQRRAQSGN